MWGRQMRIALPKLFAKKRKWEFKKADLTESTTELNNPIRGWYRIFPFYAEDVPDFEGLSWCANESDTIALVIINIGAFRDEKLTTNVLDNIREIIRFFKKNQYDIILRITYDHEGNAIEREPFFFTQVMEHITQLTAIINEFKDTIFVFQGMLIGNWGEMHTSRFVTASKLNEMWKQLKVCVKDQVFFAVRKPSFWRIVHPEYCDMSLCDYSGNMGLFDDAIFGSATHLGTFGAEARENSGWENLWNRESELEFENQLCIHVPNGGEALCGEHYLQESSMQFTIDTMKKMHVTYLNKSYDRTILELWKEWTWDLPDVWNGVNFFRYIGSHLGYRFWIQDSQIIYDETLSDELLLQVNIMNVGFANLYQEAEVFLEWKDEAGNIYTRILEADARKWNSGTVESIKIPFKPLNCKVYLYVKRKKDHKHIYFANSCDENGHVYIGDLKEIK